MAEPIVLTPQLTRTGLNTLLSLDLPSGLSGVVTHVGLTATAFDATAELAVIPNELNRWEIIDGETIDNPEAPQFNLYVEYPYEGADTPVRGFGFYLSDGTLLASYSSAQAEAYLSSRFLLDSFIHVILDGAPKDSVTVVNTGVRFNPGVRESIFQLLEESLDKTLQIHQLNEEQRIQNARLNTADQERTDLQQQLDQTRTDLNTLRSDNEQRDAANFDLLAAGQLMLAEHILDLRLQTTGGRVNG